MSTTMVHSLDNLEDWTAAAETEVYRRLELGLTVTADDIHEAVDDSALTPAQKSAWPGSLFKRLAKAGVIEKASYGASGIRSRRGGARYEWKAKGR
ncbi:hypothetical protein [Nesterenkonia sp. K-15-9-6]|uniref:hypothetical protein n=1 Tax=Nesterenkonia sp. K-15-9-6 TaxID=3093918 RepID=UPI0040448A18